MTGFADHVVLLTGASEGIGRALARQLAAEGAHLVLVARSRERLESLADEIRAAGGRCTVAPADVADPAACRALVQATLDAHGRLDVLVNNAGATMWSRLDELADPAILERLMRVNYLGSAWLTHAALPALVAARGRIVAVASLAGLTGVPERSGYAASKHAMVGFFDSLRVELRGSGVSVTVVAPDFVVSEIHRRAIGPDGRPLGTSPMRTERIMSAEQCASIVRDAAWRRRRLEVTSLRGRFLPWLRAAAPGVVDRLAARAIARRY